MHRFGSARLVVFSLVLVAASVTVAKANTITVTNTNDAVAVGDGVSLREAINAANTNLASGDAPAGSAGLDTIAFNIPGTGIHTITPGGEYDLSEPLVIDGYTQPGAAANTLANGSNAALKIEINGSSTVISLKFLAGSGGSTVRGLILNRASNQIWATAVAGNTYTGNILGIASDGLTALTSSNTCLRLEDSGNNQIGGASPGQRNVITCNNNGVWVYESTLGKSNGNVIQGNYFGTNAAGTALASGAIGNNDAITINCQGIGTVIGGTANGAGNLISGNNNGISLQPPSSNSSIVGNVVTIQGNTLGQDSAGNALGNVYYALSLASSYNVLVGGTVPGAANVIRNNGHGGSFTTPAVFGVPNHGISILGNSIDSTGGAGIVLGAIYANDNPDVDGNQNYPVIASATSDGSQTSVNGTIPSKANTQYRVEVFASPQCSAVSFGGEGRTFLGFASVTTSSTGLGTFSLPALPVASGVITSTATDPLGNTSQFSACKAITAVPPPDMTPLADLSSPADLTSLDLALVSGDLAGAVDLSAVQDLSVEKDLSVASDLSTTQDLGVPSRDLASVLDASAGDLAAPVTNLPHGASGCACSVSSRSPAPPVLPVALGFIATLVLRRRRNRSLCEEGDSNPHGSLR